MRIAITSNPTICNKALARTLAQQHRLEVIEDPCQSMCQSFGYQTLYDLPIKAQFQVREQLLNDHFQILKSSNNIVFEYSILEWCADWCRWLWSHTSTQHWQKIVQDATEIASYYDTVYCQIPGYVSAENQASDQIRPYDGYHWLDRENAEQIESLLPYVAKLLACQDKLETVNL